MKKKKRNKEETLPFYFLCWKIGRKIISKNSIEKEQFMWSHANRLRGREDKFNNKGRFDPSQVKRLKGREKKVQHIRSIS